MLPFDALQKPQMIAPLLIGNNGLWFFSEKEWVTGGRCSARPKPFLQLQKLERQKLLRIKLRFTLGWAEVLSMDHIVHIFNWAAWPEAADMNGRFQMQGGKNWILPK